MTVDDGKGANEAAATSPSQDKLPAKVEVLAKGLVNAAKSTDNKGKGQGGGKSIERKRQR